MTHRPAVPSPADRIALPGQRVLVSGALHLASMILALDAGGAEVIASDSDPVALAAAFARAPAVRCLPADLDLTFDIRRLAVAIERMGGCKTVVHHMVGEGDGTPDFAAGAFLRSMRLIHAMRPRMRRDWGSRLFLTGCPSANAVSLAIVLDRAGRFCARTEPAITCCTPDELPGLLRTDGPALRARTAVALAG